MDPNELTKMNNLTDHEISLRKMDLDDVDDLMELETDPNLARFWSWNPSISREKAISYINNLFIPHPYHRAICINNKVVGMISMTKNKGDNRCRGELGYVVASKWWGQGIATRAVKLFMSTIFEESPQLERLEALVEVENKAWLRVLEKAGFAKEGVLRSYVLVKGSARDMAVFSVLRSDPKPI